MFQSFTLQFTSAVEKSVPVKVSHLRIGRLEVLNEVIFEFSRGHHRELELVQIGLGESLELDLTNNRLQVK